jgi:hypothetical protein
VFTWQAAAHAQTHRAALLIQHGSSWSGPRVLWKCVEFAQEAIGGLALLQLAGVNSGQPPEVYDWGGGAYTVCQLDREPLRIPDRCFGSMSGPNWSDWSQTPNGWVARSTGVAGYTVRDGDVEAWTYSTGTGTRPPTVSFSQLCPPPRAPTAAAPSRSSATPLAGGAAGTTPSAETTSIASPSPALQARAPSVSPSTGTALASTGPPTKPPMGALGPWLLLGGAVIVLTGLGALNLRRRRP